MNLQSNDHTVYSFTKQFKDVVITANSQGIYTINEVLESLPVTLRVQAIHLSTKTCCRNRDHITNLRVEDKASGIVIDLPGLVICDCTQFTLPIPHGSITLTRNSTYTVIATVEGFLPNERIIFDAKVEYGLGFIFRPTLL